MVDVVERSVVRAVVRDVEEHVLLFHTRDPTSPELGTWWELPGGGIEPGETYREAIVRELAEEAGIVVGPGQVGPPTWRRRATFRYRGQRRINSEVVVLVRLPAAGPPVDGAARVGFEDEDYFDFRWWPRPSCWHPVSGSTRVRFRDRSRRSSPEKRSTSRSSDGRSCSNEQRLAAAAADRDRGPPRW